jgi:hypothetical protein
VRITDTQLYLRASALPLVIVLLGCSGADIASLPRSSSRTATVAGQPVLDINCKYLGKVPGDSSTYSSSHNYRTIDTDFYRVSFTNRTDKDIHIAGVTYRMEKGPLRGQSAVSNASIKEAWGTTVIHPGKTISHSNSFVWAKVTSNTMIKTYTFRTADDDGKSLTFSEDVSLRYTR